MSPALVAAIDGRDAMRNCQTCHPIPDQEAS